MGKRFSASYVNQFAGNTVGVAVGFAHLESTTQLKLSELDNYGDYSVYDLPLKGIPPSLTQAPSVSCEEFPAVTVPLLRSNTVLSFANCSIVRFSRTPLSSHTVC